ncbi:polyprenyl synthetase family protein [Mycoplasmatota bacterium]|nr:polyprenyl synthetase family protein [Mycoplasmatota bacterium]
MDLAEICHVDKELLDQKINGFLEKDNDLSTSYKEQLHNLIFSSGKRIRPIFTVLGSYFGEQKKDEVYTLAAIFELIHTASLIHDDIIDKADIRRGKKTLHVENGVYNSLILGNYLVALSSEYISSYQFEDMYYESFSLTDLCESEINQQSLLFNFDITFDEYINKTRNKTALLITASLLGGAKLTNASEKTLKILYEYGINLGISFQIIDDILDFTQDRMHLGKPNGADLMNGNITLPVIFALKDKKIKKHLLKLQKNASIEEYNHCIQYIINSNSIKKSKNFSKRYIKKAKKAIRKLDHEKKYILVNILDELEKRTY